MKGLENYNPKYTYQTNIKKILHQKVLINKNPYTKKLKTGIKMLKRFCKKTFKFKQ